jgi:chromate transporter
MTEAGRPDHVRRRRRRDGSNDVVPLRAATLTWFKVSLQTFGGPAGQIAVMHRELVEERRWIGERRFLHALSYCTLLPGPEAQQLSIYLGWLLNGTIGGLIAGVLFVLPGFLAILGLSMIYATWGDTSIVNAVFAGVAPAVLAIVTQALVRVGGRTLHNSTLVAMAVAAYVALAVFGVPFPFVIAAAGLVGYLGGRMRPQVFAAPAHREEDGAAATPVLIPDEALHGERGTWQRALTITLIGVILWVAPVVLVSITLGRDNIFAVQGRFFGGAALVTFGGAYAVLAYVAQKAVEVYGWLAPGEMVKGLAMAETTPGPLIMVVVFVGFMGAYRDPGALPPMLAGTVAAVLVTWVTFVPCFLFIFLGAPHIEALRHNQNLTAALAGITAAVVGVIANLAIFFALHTLFSEVTVTDWGPIHIQVPDLASFSPRAAAVTALAFVLLFKLQWSVMRTLGTCALLGAAAYLVVT